MTAIDITEAEKYREYLERDLSRFGPRPFTERTARAVERLESALAQVNGFIASARTHNALREVFAQRFFVPTVSMFQAEVMARHRERADALTAAAEEMGVSEAAVQRMCRETPWDMDEVRRRILLGEGRNW